MAGALYRFHGLTPVSMADAVSGANAVSRFHGLKPGSMADAVSMFNVYEFDG